MSKGLQDSSFPLTSSQQDLLREVATALAVKIESLINNQSDVCTPKFAEEFQNRLLLYHAMNEEVLKKKTFEFAFARACLKAGRKARLVSNPVNPGTDAIVDGVSFSLKTEASRSISQARITISKLMEARWIRECRDGNDFLDGVRSRIVPHLEKYSRILMLRAFGLTPSLFRYNLDEIPLALLLKVSTLKPRDFSHRTANGSSSADVHVDGRRAFSLRLDGSVEKVTISGLDVGLCVTHGEWKIPVRRVL